MIKPEDLNREQRQAFDLWRSFGFSQQTAMEALIEDGTVTLSEHDQLVRSFANLGMSDAAARFALKDLEPEPSSPQRSSWRPGPGDALKVVARIEELGADLRSRGVEAAKALSEAAFAVFRGSA